MPDYLQQATIPNGQTQVSVPITMNNANFIWEIEQITVNYSNAADSPSVTITKNGYPYAPTALLVPGPLGQSQTFAEEPYLYKKATDDVEVVVTGGSAGSVVTVFAQYREFLTTDSDMYGR